MLLIITLIILFTYTVILLMFFMGWCALLPKITHPRPEVMPFSVVKSPRRNSVFISFESITSASIQSLEYIHHKLSLSSSSIVSKQQHKGQPKQHRHSSPSNGPASDPELGLRSDICATADKKSRSASTGDSGVSRSSSAQTSAGEPLHASGGLLAAIPKSASGQSDYLHPKYSLPPIKIDITDHLLADCHLLRTPVRLKCSPMKTRSRSFDDRVSASPSASPSKASAGWQQHMPLANLRRLKVANTLTTSALRRQSHYRGQPPAKSSSTHLLTERSGSQPSSRRRYHQSRSFRQGEPYRQCLLPSGRDIEASSRCASTPSADNGITIV